MSRFVAAFAVVGCLLAGMLTGSAGARAEVVITVNKSTQRLSVAVNGVREHQWPVSTARRGYTTPNGTYHPVRLARKWYSRKYHMSPMPYSIFFHGGFAIHGSYETAYLGRPASHGCVRLLPRHAAVLFKIVRANRRDTKIVVTGARPSYRAVSRRHRAEEHARRRRAEEQARRRQAERRAERRARYRSERTAERRTRARRAGFEDAFAPRRATYGAGQPYPTWDDILNKNNPGQRAFRKWWYRRQ
jgi:hypothetical protein